MDEKSKELHGEDREPLPCRPAGDDRRAAPRRTDTEYQRNGTANIFIWFEPLTGRRHLRVTERRTKEDWAREVRWLVEVAHADAERNAKSAKMEWRFTTQDARIKLKHLYPTLQS